MVQIHGVHFHAMKLIQKALVSFYGLGPVKASKMMARHSLHNLQRVGALTPKQLISLSAELAQLTIGEEAKNVVRENIRRLIRIGSYRGKRHAVGLPVRGQNTHSQIATATKINRRLGPK